MFVQRYRPLLPFRRASPHFRSRAQRPSSAYTDSCRGRDLQNHSASSHFSNVTFDE